jgi:CBS domain containing-hemolysin-like protein
MTLGFLELFTTGDLGGLWLVLLGWFIATSAVSEARYRLALAALGDLRVGTVMSAHPTCAPADWTVADFLDHRARIAPYPSYPVTDPAGRPVGLLRIAQAVQLSSDDRQSSAVSLVCTPMSDCLIIAETDRVADVLPRVARLRGDDAAIVTHHGIVSGLLSPSDLNRAVRVASALGSPTS